MLLSAWSTGIISLENESETNLEGILILVPLLADYKLVLLKDGWHPVVPHEHAAVLSYLHGRECRVVCQEFQTILCLNQTPLHFEYGVTFHLFDVFLQLHQLVGVGWSCQSFLSNELVVSTESA